MKEEEHASKIVSLYVRKANAFLEYLLAPSADILLAAWCYAAVPKCKDDATEHASSFSCFYIVKEKEEEVFCKPTYSACHTREESDQEGTAYATIFKHTF